ncbi:MAG TPA: inositol monophosphatase family protein [Pirellulaceae bacterium]|nr:inositol monophosphatase family protein [Pirellulaceae bacterium]HMO92733.1 inositol monophosphatase family protein [Pirellulaceae bacterium]HMP70285.1 inositol monophosphatase family protein [Pirellulaceae bacterium]
MEDQEIAERLDAARRFCVQGGKLTLNWFRDQGVGFERKLDASPVTVADRSAEQLIRQLISENFPEDGILGEEFPEKPGTNQVRWILDPIDGTKSFISGVPLYGTMVGVEVDGQAKIGAIYMPGLDEGAFAAIGHGAWVFQGSDPPQRSHVRHREKIQDAVILTSEVEAFSTRNADPVFRELSKKSYFVRTWGDCYGYFLVASGRADVMIDPILNIWDAAAVAPIISEAGGLFIDWAGHPRIDAGEALGIAAGLVSEVLEITKPFSGKF